MAMVIKYCEVCGERVSTEDLERETAVIYNELAYCRSCKKQVLPLIEQERAAKVKRTTISAPAVSRPISSGIRRSAITTQTKVNTTTERRGKSNTQNPSLIIGLAVGSGVLLLLILFFLFSGNSKDPSNTSNEETSKNLDPEKKEPPKKNPNEVKDLQNEKELQETKAVQELLASIKNVDYVFAKEKILKQQAQINFDKNRAILTQALEQLMQRHESEAQKQFDEIKSKVNEVLEKAQKSTTPTYANSKFNEAEKLWEVFRPIYKDTKYWEMRDEEIALIKRARESKQSTGNPPKDNKPLTIENGPSKDLRMIPREGQWDFEPESSTISVKTKEKEGRLEIGEKAVQNFDLTFEFRSNNATKGEVKVMCHVPETSGGGLKNLVLTLTTAPSESQWNRIQITYQDPVYTVHFNEEPPQSLDGEKEKFSKSGRLLLICSPQSSYDFRNLQLKATP